jgi:hypothetical protein
MVALLTLDVAKSHLRVDHTDDDADITRKIAQASAIALVYIKKTVGTIDPEDPSIVDWTDVTVPDDVAAAIELILSKLYDDRAGGEHDNPNVAMGYLTPEVTALLHRWRDPALA